MIRFFKRLWYAFVQAWKESGKPALPAPPQQPALSPDPVPEHIAREYKELRMSQQWARFAPVMPQNEQEYWAIKQAEGKF